MTVPPLAPAAAEIQRSAPEISWPPPADAALPAPLRLSPVDFTAGKQRPPVYSFTPALPSETQRAQVYPSQPHPSSFYPAYPTPSYPVAYPVVAGAAAIPVTADPLIQALMSATAARTAPEHGLPAFDPAVLTSILPALLASGWLRIEPDFAHLLPQELMTPEVEPRALALPAIDPLEITATPICPSLDVGWSGGLSCSALAEVDQFFLDVPIEPLNRGGLAGVPLDAIRPAHQTAMNSGFKPTGLFALGTVLYEPGSEMRAVPVESVCEEMLPLQPAITLECERPGWGPKALTVQITLRPHDLSFLDIPMEAGPWARE